MDGRQLAQLPRYRARIPLEGGAQTSGMLVLTSLVCFPPNSCFFGSGFSANLTEKPEPFHFFDSGFSAKLAEKPEPKGFIKKVDGGVRLGGESCNWYCRSVLFRFTVLRRKICVGGGITVSNRSFPFGRFWFLACVPLAWLTLG